MSEITGSIDGEPAFTFTPDGEVEKWPNLTHQNRDKLYQTIKSVGISMDNKWLSDAAIETIEKLKFLVKELADVADYIRKKYEYDVQLSESWHVPTKETKIKLKKAEALIEEARALL